MTNPRYNMDLGKFFTKKTETRRIKDALYNDDIGEIFSVLKEVIKRGDFLI